MAIPLVPKLLRAHLAELAENDARIDGRQQWEGRDVEIETSVCPGQRALPESGWGIPSFSLVSSSR